MGGLKIPMPPVTKCGVSKGEGAEDCPSVAQDSTSIPEYRGREHRMLQEVELHCTTTSPRKVGDCSLATFRTSVIFENDRVQAEVLAQC